MSFKNSMFICYDLCCKCENILFVTPTLFQPVGYYPALLGAFVPGLPVKVAAHSLPESLKQDNIGEQTVASQVAAIV